VARVLGGDDVNDGASAGRIRGVAQVGGIVRVQVGERGAKLERCLELQRRRDRDVEGRSGGDLSSGGVADRRLESRTVKFASTRKPDALATQSWYASGASSSVIVKDGGGGVLRQAEFPKTARLMLYPGGPTGTRSLPQTEIEALSSRWPSPQPANVPRPIARRAIRRAERRGAVRLASATIARHLTTTYDIYDPTPGGLSSEPARHRVNDESMFPPGSHANTAIVTDDLSFDLGRPHGQSAVRSRLLLVMGVPGQARGPVTFAS
jgi:hypothetical protein